jgi:hypothetical protein
MQNCSSAAPCPHRHPAAHRCGQQIGVLSPRSRDHGDSLAHQRRAAASKKPPTAYQLVIRHMEIPALVCVFSRPVPVSASRPVSYLVAGRFTEATLFYFPYHQAPCTDRAHWKQRARQCSRCNRGTGKERRQKQRNAERGRGQGHRKISRD